MIIDDEKNEMISDHVILSAGALEDEFASFLSTEKYFDRIQGILYHEKPKLEVDYNDLLKWATDDAIITSIHENIDDSIYLMGTACSRIMSAADDKSLPITRPIIRLINYGDTITIRKLSTDYLKKMISINCVISRVSDEKPYLQNGVSRCYNCDYTVERIVKKCSECSENSMEFDPQFSTFISHRSAIIQELPDDLPAGQLPISRNMDIFGTDLTQSPLCRAGSRIKASVIVNLDYDKTTVNDLFSNKRDPLSILRDPGTTFILGLTAHNLQSLDEEKVTTDHKITQKEIDMFQTMKDHNNPQWLTDLLVQSYAPHIHGHDAIKECILLSLVGANISTESVRKRGDINILLVGNAGVAKSQLLLFAKQIASRCIYSAGKGASAVGLTAAVVKDDRTGSLMLEAGATVLADQGTLIIDEFDKLKPDDRSALHEVMEQQTCSVAKGGIVATLNARTAILAAANPITGTYDSYKTLAENTGYPTSLLSRFDFIFVIKDIIDEKQDTAIANRMLSLGYDDTHKSVQLSSTVLAKYIQYVKSTFSEISLSKEAQIAITNTYLSLRKKAEKDNRDNSVSAITVTARIVDVLQRATMARAKLCQRTEATEQDVKRVVFLLSKMYESFGVFVSDEDQHNTINLGLLYGKPLARMNKKKVLIQICDEMTDSGKSPKLDFDQLILELMATRKFVTRFDAEDAANEAKRHGILRHQKGNIYIYDRDVISQGDN